MITALTFTESLHNLLGFYYLPYNWSHLRSYVFIRLFVFVI